MNEIHDARRIALESQALTRDVSLMRLSLLTDVEALSGGTMPAEDLLRCLADLRRAQSGSVALESLLPEIRTAALLLASARKDWEGDSPGRFADAADWLAARILILGLSHVELAAAQLPRLDEANRRLCRLAARFDRVWEKVQPVLVGASEAGLLLHGWRPLADISTHAGSFSEHSAQLRRIYLAEIPQWLARFVRGR
ncbi:hypothetical protein [Paludibacterium yongneupense]|uniref:hypothetical protein n=1 Tax=Paludibacterium yongneupense TaxID=400061 RepID=UPI000683F023|nr:hypothetical protein [Paludibacterium yongneupense]